MTDLPTIEPIPGGIDAAPRAARRGRGRPPALNPDGSRVHLPNKRERRERAPRRDPVRPPGRGSLKSRVGGMLVLANTIVTVIPATRRDALSPVEIDALATSIDAQCNTSPRFKKYVEAALDATSVGGILGVVAVIGARRAARHGIVPPMIDPMLGALMGDNSPITAPDEQPIEPLTPNPASGYPLGSAPDIPPSGAPGLPSLQQNGGAVEFDYEQDAFARVT